jgi:hypothetical protein
MPEFTCQLLQFLTPLIFLAVCIFFLLRLNRAETSPDKKPDPLFPAYEGRKWPKFYNSRQRALYFKQLNRKD